MLPPSLTRKPYPAELRIPENSEKSRAVTTVTSDSANCLIICRDTINSMDESTVDDSESYLFCYECGNTLTAALKGLCPICLENNIISMDFALLTPLNADESKGPHISLALMDDEKNIWWDEVVETEKGLYITLVRLPKNCGFIPRWLVDFGENALLDPITRENAVSINLVNE